MEVIASQRPESIWCTRSNKKRPVQDKTPAVRPRNNFVHLRRNGDFSDAILWVEGVDFHVHKNILACCSDYFRALLTGMSHQSPESRGGQGIGGDQHAASPTPKATTPITFSKSQHCPSSETPQGLVLIPSTNGQSQGPTTTSTTTTTQIKPSCQTGKGQSGPKTASRLGSRCEVNIDGISPAIMNQILDFAYGGHVSILQNNVEQLLTAADRFQVFQLVHECCDFLIGQLSMDNCISIFKFASNFYDCLDLKEHAGRYILNNFETLYQTSPEFDQLTASELSGFLSDDNLNVQHEETIVESVVKWVSADPHSREDSIYQLVKCARIGLMVPGQLTESFDVRNPLCNFYAGETTVVKVMAAVLERQQEVITDVDISMFTPRLPRDLMVLVGGSNFGFPLGTLEVFDCRTWGWSPIGPFGFDPRSYHGLTCVGNVLYVIGGFNGQMYLSGCCKLCLDSEDMRWESVTPMNTKRCYVGVVQLKGAIYAVGGYDGFYRLNSAERFDVKRNQWSFIEPMSQQRSDAGVAVLNEKMYVCGGFSGVECLSAVEMYDPDSGQWSRQPSMPQGRSGLGMVAHDGCLYAVGGFNGLDTSVRLSNMECYDPKTRQWTSLTPMPHPRSNLAVAVLEGIMYAIGGYNGDRTSSVVECYDFDHDAWFQSSRLNHNCSALSVCVISGLFNTASILGRGSPKHRRSSGLT